MLFALIPPASMINPPVADPRVNAQVPVLVLAIWPIVMVVPEATFTTVVAAVVAVL